MDAITVDDMESYKDEALLEPWATWIDGFEDPSNGALIGNGATGSPETVIVHGGSQSLPLHYDNGAAAQERQQKHAIDKADFPLAINGIREPPGQIDHRQSTQPCHR